MRVLVVDDEPLARNGVIAQLSAFDDVEVVGQCGDGQSAIAGIRQLRPDVVVLDVQMPDLDGLDVLRCLPLEERPLAILLTAHETFAVSAFELDAIDYLLKPLDDERFSEAIARARRRLGKSSLPTEHTLWQPMREPERFEVRVGRRAVFVPVEDVEYLQADGDYVALHVDGKRHLIRESLQRLQERLNAGHFLRIHRSVIVRLDRVAEMRSLSNRDALVRLHDGTLLRASRTYVDTLRARLRLSRA